MATQNPRGKINWVNTLFLTLCPLISIVGTVLLCIYTSISWKTWVLFGVYTYLTGLSIAVGYHRLFSHQTYRAPAPVRIICLLLAAATFEGSALEWSTDHRNHHRYTDTDEDPYSIKRGFWFAHIGWLIRLDTSKRDFANVADLQADRWCRLQHRYFPFIAIFMGFILPTLLAWSWGEPLAGFIIAGGLRATLNHHFTFFINSLCHTMGKQTYSKTQTARDHWVAAIFTYGEGYHNFHHKFPLDYRNGVRRFHYDPAKWMIWALSKVGLAHDLKRVKQHRIAKHLVSQSTSSNSLVLQAQERLMQLIQRVERLDREYVEQLKTLSCKTTIKNYRRQLRKSRRELAHNIAMWSKLTKQYA